MNTEGPRWWSRLVPGKGPCLMDMGSMAGKIVVVKTTGNGRNSEFRLYASFDNYIELYKHYVNVADKTFHEMFFGEYSQKPHFDIDMPPEENEQVIFDSVLGDILTVFKEKFSIDLDLENDILVYSSHGPEKKSFHLLIDNYCHPGNEEAKEFYRLVAERSPWKKFLDPGVYNSRQSLRLLWSHKFESTRTKNFQQTFKFKNNFHTNIISEPENLKQLAILKKSLISETSECLILKCLVIKKEKIFADLDCEIDLDQVKQILFDFDPNHKIVKKEKMLITLKKERSYHCRVCGSTHDNENPYLTIRSPNEIFFHCRRSGGSVKIGKIDLVIRNNSPELSLSGSGSKLEIPEYKFVEELGSSGDNILEKLQKVSGVTGHFPQQKTDIRKMFMSVLK